MKRSFVVTLVVVLLSHLVGAAASAVVPSSLMTLSAGSPGVVASPRKATQKKASLSELDQKAQPLLPKVLEPDAYPSESDKQANEYLYLERVKQSLQTIKQLAPWPWDEDITPIIQAYQQADLGRYQGQAKSRYMLSELGMHEWGRAMTDFSQLAELLFSFQDDAYQKEHKTVFNAAVKALNNFRQWVNFQVLWFHPGYKLRQDRLVRQYHGEGMTIAVFDVFDPALLEQQRRYFSGATIEKIKNFGNPVNLNHGNSVIDVILSLAPAVNIVPVSAESATYNEAMAYINERADIHIVNMSRAFAEKEGQLDPEFSRHLHSILQDKLVIKSLGNTGTDLDGQDTPLRQKLGLPPVGSLFAYDLALIRQFAEQIQDQPQEDHLLFAVNLAPFEDQLSLTATIPGQHIAARNRTFGIAAEAVFSQSSGNFESGSSFAAPQLTAISALLWQAHLNRDCFNGSNPTAAVIEALRHTAIPSELGEETTGLGLVNAQAAMKRLGICFF